MSRDLKAMQTPEGRGSGRGGNQGGLEAGASLGVGGVTRNVRQERGEQEAEGGGEPRR